MVPASKGSRRSNDRLRPGNRVRSRWRAGLLPSITVANAPEPLSRLQNAHTIYLILIVQQVSGDLCTMIFSCMNFLTFSDLILTCYGEPFPAAF